MAKKIKFESFRYRFLIAAEAASYRPNCASLPGWEDFVRGLEFAYEKGEVGIAWQLAKPGRIVASLDEASFHIRGDNEKDAARQRESGLLDAEDPIKLNNATYFRRIVNRVAESAGYSEMDGTPWINEARTASERDFHDAWAAGEDVGSIDVRAANEACTAPEMRYITQRLGDINGKRLLDVGCGLGEASVYFAIRGADVTSADLSQGMLDATARLAQANRVCVKPHLASAEELRLPSGATYDIIYAGNLLHHVDIEETLIRIKPHLAPDGMFVTWDPLAYNPAINVYRSIATEVRTPDEHPLKWGDIKLFHKYFGTVETRYFWLSTLVIFVIMALAQRRNPNKERFWKVVVREGETWRWLYRPLEALDRLMLALFPPLRLLCWNVVIFSKA